MYAFIDSGTEKNVENYSDMRKGVGAGARSVSENESGYNRDLSERLLFYTHLLSARIQHERPHIAHDANLLRR